MNLTINARETQGVTILELTGRLTLGEECNSLRQRVSDLLGANKKRILLNLADVTHTDSSGIGILVESVILTVKAGGEFKLMNLSRVLRNTLAVHRLLPAFEVFDSEAAALASFQ